ADVDAGRPARLVDGGVVAAVHDVETIDRLRRGGAGDAKGKEEGGGAHVDLPEASVARRLAHRDRASLHDGVSPRCQSAVSVRSVGRAQAALRCPSSHWRATWSSRKIMIGRSACAAAANTEAFS